MEFQLDKYAKATVTVKRLIDRNIRYTNRP